MNSDVMTVKEIAEYLRVGLHEAERIARELPHYKGKGRMVARVNVVLYSAGIPTEKIHEIWHEIAGQKLAALLVERSSGIAEELRALAMKTTSEALQRAFNSEVRP